MEHTNVLTVVVVVWREVPGGVAVARREDGAIVIMITPSPLAARVLSECSVSGIRPVAAGGGEGGLARDA